MLSLSVNLMSHYSFHTRSNDHSFNMHSSSSCTEGVLGVARWQSAGEKLERGSKFSKTGRRQTISVEPRGRGNTENPQEHQQVDKLSILIKTELLSAHGSRT